MIFNAKLLPAVKAENIFLSTAVQPELLDPVLTSESPPTTRTIGKYVTVQSQPLIHNFKWNDKRQRVADWPIDLNNFGYGMNISFCHAVYLHTVFNGYFVHQKQ